MNHLRDVVVILALSYAAMILFDVFATGAPELKVAFFAVKSSITTSVARTIRTILPVSVVLMQQVDQVLSRVLPVGYVVSLFLR